MAADSRALPLVWSNALDGETGSYLLQPMSREEFAHRIEELSCPLDSRPESASELEALLTENPDPSSPFDPENLAHAGWGLLSKLNLGASIRQGVGRLFGARPFLPEDLSQAGWGVVFPVGTPPEVRRALAELLSHRKRQVSQGLRYRELEYRPGESASDFAKRHAASVLCCDPDRLPYYLLLVASPEVIPFDFQSTLDIHHAVGRLDLGAPEDYAAYARAVVARETGAPAGSPRGAFFAPANPGDASSNQARSWLIEPLAEELAPEARALGWRFDSHLAENATKEKLAGCFDSDRPLLLLSSCHGMLYPEGHPVQRRRQGAMVCQDWPGPEAWNGGPVPQQFFFSGEDVPREARLDGMVVFHVGCFGAGTPRLSSFPQGPQRPLAERDFVGYLPQRLLAQGALAVVSHIDLSWAYSYLSLDGRSRLGTFRDALRALLRGAPVGLALDAFNRRYGRLFGLLQAERRCLQRAPLRDRARLAILSTACYDARGYVVLGDPAVRLPVAGAPPASHG